MSSIDVPLERGRFGQTARRDSWWVQPLLTFLGLGDLHRLRHLGRLPGRPLPLRPLPFAVLLAPNFSATPGEDSWFGAMPRLDAQLRHRAMLILWAPGGFRFTCYYYRGAYYKAFWADPPSCTVGEPRKNYLGERSFPLIIQNIHRYFLYLALLFLVLLAHDVWKALWFDGKLRHRRRHAGAAGQRDSAGLLHVRLPLAPPPGRRNVRSLWRSRPVRKNAYDCVSCLNRRHMLFAWLSLFWVGFSDLYVRMCSMGIWTDWRIL